jgi:hypothetical protein
VYKSGLSAHITPLDTDNYQVIHEHRCQVHLLLKFISENFSSRPFARCAASCETEVVAVVVLYPSR